MELYKKAKHRILASRCFDAVLLYVWMCGTYRVLSVPTVYYASVVWSESTSCFAALNLETALLL